MSEQKACVDSAQYNFSEHVDFILQQLHIMLIEVEPKEKRYQQLEQVVENLFHSFCFYCKHDEIIKSYRTMLEALEVSLDD